MHTTKAVYWIAIGIFALGMSSEYQKGNLPTIHRAAARAEGVICRVVSRAEQTLAEAQLLTNRRGRDLASNDRFMAFHQAQIDRAMALRQAHLDRVRALRQADLDSAQARLDRLRAELDHAQAQRVQILERVRVKLSDAANRRVMVICPKTGARVAVNPEGGAAGIDADLPQIEVEDSF